MVAYVTTAPRAEADPRPNSAQRRSRSSYRGEAATTEMIGDSSPPHLESFARTWPGVAGVIRKFIPAGVHHILIGPDRLLFLVGLLLLGGSTRQLLIVVTSFTVAHSI